MGLTSALVSSQYVPRRSPVSVDQTDVSPSIDDVKRRSPSRLYLTSVRGRSPAIILRALMFMDILLFKNLAGCWHGTASCGGLARLRETGH